MFHQAAFIELALLLGAFECFSRSAAASGESQPAGGWSSAGEDSWNYWWNYQGLSGPDYWGVMNSDWFMCEKGRRQSPINIETSALIYDPHLTPLRVDNDLISGYLYNDGHAIVFSSKPPQSAKATQVNVEQELGNNKQTNVSVAKRTPFSPEENSPSALFMTDLKRDDDHLGLGLASNVELSIAESKKLQPDSEGLKASLADEALEEQSSELSDASVQSEQNQADEQAANGAVQLTGAGLAYSYKFEAINLRFGLESRNGSEHQINSRAFAAELQLLAYNSVLFKSYAEASTKPHGLLAVAILIDVAPTTQSDAVDKQQPSVSSEQLEILLARLAEIKNRGSSTQIRSFNLSALMPETNYFVTYEGSLTVPGCHESVNWLVLNKALYIKQSTLDALRSVSADELSSPPTGHVIAGNLRLTKPVNNRLIRTNIRPPTLGESKGPETCKRLWTQYEYKQSH